MATTVIDRLIVTLGIDASNFKREINNSTTALNRTNAAQKQQTAAAVVGTRLGRNLQQQLKATETQSTNTAMTMAARGKQGSEFFSTMQRAAMGLSVAVGALQLRQLAEHVIDAGAAVGRFAANLGIGTRELTNWAYAVEHIAGGTEEGVKSVFANLAADFENFAATGQSAFAIYFKALGIHITDAQGKIRPTVDLLLDLNKAVQGMDPRTANQRLAGAGINDQAMRTFLMKSPAVVNAELRRQDTTNPWSKPVTDGMIELQNAIVGVQQDFEKLGITLVNDARPQLMALAGIMHDVASYMRGTIRFSDIGKTDAERAADKSVPGILDDPMQAAKASADLLNRINESIQAAGKESHDTLAPLIASFVKWLGGDTKLATDLINDPVKFARESLEWLKRIDISVKESGLKAFTILSDIWTAVQAWLGFGKSAASGGGFSASGDGAEVSTEVPPNAQALLQTIMTDEAGMKDPYHTAYGGAGGPIHFDDLSRHPNIRSPIPGKPGMVSTAAGGFQMLYSNWLRAQKALNLPDFTPPNQAKAAWWLAQEAYGPGLEADIGSKDPLVRDHVRRVMARVWTSTPGGEEEGKNASSWDRRLNSAIDSKNAAHSVLPMQKQNMLERFFGVPQQQIDPETHVLPDRMRIGIPHFGSSPNVGPQSMNGGGSEVHIAQLTINTQAKDAVGIGRDIAGSLRAQMLASQANAGLA